MSSSLFFFFLPSLGSASSILMMPGLVVWGLGLPAGEASSSKAYSSFLPVAFLEAGLFGFFLLPGFFDVSVDQGSAVRVERRDLEAVLAWEGLLCGARFGRLVWDCVIV